jgi:hypothetical protein
VEALEERLALSSAHLAGHAPVLHRAPHHARVAKHHHVRHGQQQGPIALLPLAPLAPTPVLPPGGGIPVPLPLGPYPDLSGDHFSLVPLCGNAQGQGFGSNYGTLQITKENADGTFQGSFTDEGSGHNLSGAVSGVIKDHSGPDAKVNLHTEDVTFTFWANPAYEFLGLIQTTDTHYYPSWKVTDLVIKGMVDNLQSPQTPQDCVMGAGYTPSPPPK